MTSQATRLVVEIDGSGAKTGAQVVNDALKSIEASVATAEKARLAFQTNLSKLGGTGLDAAVTKINTAFKSISDQVTRTKMEVYTLARSFTTVADSASKAIGETRGALVALKEAVRGSIPAITDLAKAFDKVSTSSSKAIGETRGALVALKEAARGSIPAITDLAKAFDKVSMSSSKAIGETRGALVALKEAVRGSIPAITDLANAFTQIGTKAKSSVAQVKIVMTDLSTLITTPEASLTSLAAAFARIGNQKFNALVEAFQLIDGAIKLTKGKVNNLVETFAKIEKAAKDHLLEAGREVIKLGNAFTGKPMQAVVAFSNKLLELGIDATIGMKAATTALVGLATAMIPLVRKIANISSKFGKLGASIEAGLAPVWEQLLRLGNAFAFPKEKVAEFSAALASIGTGSGKHLKPIITALRDLGDAFSTSILAAKRLRAGLGRIGTAALAGTDRAIVSLYDLGKQSRASMEDVKILSKVLKRLGVNATYGIGQARSALIKLTRSLKLPLASLSKLGFAFNNVGVQAEIGVNTARTSLIQLYRALRLALPAVSKLGFALSNIGVQAEIGIKKANAAIRGLKTAFTAPTKAVTALKRSLGTIGTAANNAAKKVNIAMTSMEKALTRPKLSIKVLANAMRNIGTQAAAAAKKVKIAMRAISIALKDPAKHASALAAAMRAISGISFARFNTQFGKFATSATKLLDAITKLLQPMNDLYVAIAKVTTAAEFAATAVDRFADALKRATTNARGTVSATNRIAKAFADFKAKLASTGSALKALLSPFSLLSKALSGIWTLLKSTAKAMLYVGRAAITAAGKVIKLAGALANIATLGIAGRLGRLALRIITLGRAGRTAANDIGVLTKAWRLFRNVYMARMAGGGLVGVQKSIVDARIEWDKMRSTFVAVTGSTQGSRRELDWLRKTADDLGSSFTHASFPFAKLAAAAKGTALEGEGVRKIFEDISVATTTLHMSGDDLKFTFYALQQMISKGSVTMEELRRQLGERIPGAFQDAAKAFAKMKGDITLGTEDLEKAIKAGLVDPIEFLPLLAEAIADRFRDGLMIARVALQAEINRMTTMWFFFKKEISEGPLDDAWIVFTQTLTQAIERMMPHAKTIGEILAKIVDWASEWVEILTANPNAVADYLNLDGWGRLYDYLGGITDRFIEANFPGMKGQIEGLGGAFSFLFDSLWLLPDVIIIVGSMIQTELDHWPEVWEAASGLIAAVVEVLSLKVQEIFSVMMVHIKSIVVNGFNDILASIAAGARQLSDGMAFSAGKATEAFIAPFKKKRGLLVGPIESFMQSSIEAAGSQIQVIGEHVLDTFITRPFANASETWKVDAIDVTKEVGDVHSEYAGKIIAEEVNVGVAMLKNIKIQEDLVGGRVEGIKTMMVNNAALQTQKRKDAAEELEFTKLLREDDKFTAGISSGGNFFKDSEERINAAEAQIRAAQADKPKLEGGSGGRGGAGAAGKTPTQLLAEENRLRNERYTLEKAYYELLDASAPGTYEMTLRQLDADKARTDAKLQMNEALQKGIITEEQHRMAIAATEEQYKKTMDAQSKYVQVIKDDFASIFGSLADMAKEFAGEQSETYRVLFAMSKAFAIADATMKMASAIMEAWNTPWPLNLGAVAQVTTATAALLSSIASVTYSGGYDKGGAIPAGSYGMVGEYGPEFVKGPATVTGREDTAKMIQELIAEMKANGSGSGGNLRIINAIDPELFSDYAGSAEGERVIMNVVKRNQTTVRNLARG